MADQAEEIMNLDLNLRPITLSNTIGAELVHSYEEAMNVGEWIEPSPDDTIREFSRTRLRLRRRWGYFHPPSEPGSPPSDSDRDTTSGPFGVGSGETGGENGGGLLQTEEGKCDGHMKLMENGTVDDKERVDNPVSNEGSFFDCNICLDLAKDPIVTCCGHLFCWPCIYRWLHIYGEAKECPVCKGEVTLKNLTPIYGRGNHTREPEDDLEVKIPIRPPAKRVESLRQTIHRRASFFPVEEMIQGLQRDPSMFSVTDRHQNLLDRITRLTRIMHALQREQRQTTVAQPSSSSVQDVVDLTQDRHPSLNRSGHVARGMYDRHSEELQRALLDDRDSVSSVAAEIHGESQTVDTTVEIDSGVSLSASSSRRRYDASRSSDVDSVDSRSLRRRRLN